MQIHPALLTANFNTLLLLISELESAHAHLDIDIIDWLRTPMKTVPAEQVLTIKTKSLLSFDLMMDYPSATVNLLISDPRVDTIIINLECKDPIDPIIDLIHFHKKKVGISVNPNNHFYQIVPFFPQVDLIQVYTVEPGAQGQPFLPERLQLTKNIRDFGFDCLIEIDGGVRHENIALFKKFPIDILSVGGEIEKDIDPLAEYKKLVVEANSTTN